MSAKVLEVSSMRALTEEHLTLNTARLLRVLQKEEFRTFLIENKARAIVLDNCDYSERPNTIGCFYRDGQWISYVTDERSLVVEEKQFQTEVDAFKWTAKMAGLSYTPNRELEKQLQGPKDNLDILEKRISNAITCLKAIEKSLSGTASQAAIREDVIFLLVEKRKLREQSSKIETAVYGPAIFPAKVLGLTSNIAELISRAQEKRVIDKAKLDWTITKTRNILAEARAHGVAELACVQLDELVSTQILINNYVKEGKLHGPALDMAYRRLDELNELLRKNFEQYTTKINELGSGKEVNKCLDFFNHPEIKGWYDNFQRDIITMPNDAFQEFRDKIKMGFAERWNIVAKDTVISMESKGVISRYLEGNYPNAQRTVSCIIDYFSGRKPINIQLDPNCIPSNCKNKTKNIILAYRDCETLSNQYVKKVCEKLSIGTWPALLDEDRNYYQEQYLALLIAMKFTNNYLRNLLSGSVPKRNLSAAQFEEAASYDKHMYDWYCKDADGSYSLNPRNKKLYYYMMSQECATVLICKEYDNN